MTEGPRWRPSRSTRGTASSNKSRRLRLDVVLSRWHTGRNRCRTRPAVRQYQNASFIRQQGSCVMNIKTCAVYNNDAAAVGIYFPLPPPSSPSLPPVLCDRSQLQMGQATSVKFSEIVVCSSSTIEEEHEEFQPHHPRFVVTAEVPDSKPASLQPNRYSESNRSFQSLAKDSFVLELVSRAILPRLLSRPCCGFRRAAVPAADYTQD